VLSWNVSWVKMAFRKRSRQMVDHAVRGEGYRENAYEAETDRCDRRFSGNRCFLGSSGVERPIPWSELSSDVGFGDNLHACEEYGISSVEEHPPSEKPVKLSANEFPRPDRRCISYKSGAL
jgi:hypothetical protein